MKNQSAWRPSKYVMRGGRLRASRDITAVGAGSRLVTDLVAEAYAKHLPLHARGRLADLGCGKVPLYAAYQALATSVTCVDWGNTPHATSHLDVETSLAEPLPFADGAFDTIILSDVLEHLPNPDILWSEMARLLAPGGHALINVPFMYGIHEAPFDFYRYTEFALRRFAQQAGLDVIVLDALGGSLHVLADFLAKHASHLPLLGPTIADLMQGAAAALCRLPGLGAANQRTGARFPLGYFMVVRKTQRVSGHDVRRETGHDAERVAK